MDRAFNIAPPLSKSLSLLTQWIAALCLLTLSNTLYGAELVDADSLEPVTMQIRWLHQFQFAGYYAALDKGFYRDAGLDVSIITGAPDRNPVSEVLAGRAQYGEANSELLFHYLKGEPLVALASIFQHSPSVLLAMQGSGIRTAQDLLGKNIMMVGGSEDIDFLAMLANEGLTQDQLNIIPSSYNIQDLISGKTDLFNAYSTNEPFYLKENGYKAFVIDPGNYGIDFYSDILFTTQDEITDHPQRVKNFRAATIKGWEYAMSHKSEIIDLILNKYHSKKSRAHLEFEAAAMENLILSRYIPVGNINRGRFEYMAEMMAKFNLVNDGYSLDSFFYEPNPQVDLKLFWQVSLSILLLLTLAIAAIYFMWHLNQRLRTEVKGRQQAEDHFRNIVDNLQDVYYRADNQNRITAASPSVKENFGYSVEDLIGLSISGLYEPPYKHSDFLSALEQANGYLHGYETKILRKDQSTCWVSVNSQYTIIDGNITGIEGTIRDINDLKSHKERYQSMAMQDSLTQLPNRRYLTETLQHSIAQNIRHQKIGALLFIDLNKFKPVNDQHGHDVGDLLLIDIARRFKSTVRKEDSVIRIGGDEFVVVLPILSANKNEAMKKTFAVAEKLIAASEKPFSLRDDIAAINISASIGIALFPVDGDDIYRLINKADKAMYTAKASNETRAIIYEEPGD